ncbi:MAG: hypothetical protein DME26_07315 [Verrucomicrobia bacterium]|nr:MAG: hypothetical protein DME26_07315 [Verrucomicrobiota bacterium]
MLRRAMKRDIASYRTRLQEGVQAKKYAARFERGSRRRIDRREQRTARKIFAELADCMSVLDVPCGAGRFLQSLIEGGRRVLGVDASREILIHAERHARALNAQADFAQGDASKLPFTGNAVDAIFCNRLLHHILKREERAVILREFHRVSRRYVIVSFFDYQAFGGLRRMIKRLKGRKPAYEGQPTLDQFTVETDKVGFVVGAIVPTGPAWVTQKYFVLEKV